jgi:hypothetical protein
MAKEARAGSKSEVARARQLASARERSIGADAAATSHPLLHLQQLAGNRAVRRLVTARPHTIHRMVLQRVLSPETAAMGRAATGDLISGWAGASLATLDAAEQASAAAQQAGAAAQQTGAANTAVADLLMPVTMVQAALAVAETEPAPGGGTVTPVTPTPVPLPTSEQAEE